MAFRILIFLGFGFMLPLFFFRWLPKLWILKFRVRKYFIQWYILVLLRYFCNIEIAWVLWLFSFLNTTSPSYGILMSVSTPKRKHKLFLLCYLIFTLQKGPFSCHETCIIWGCLTFIFQSKMLCCCLSV